MTSLCPSIVHITPHLGGGVGRVLLNYLRALPQKKRRYHRVIALDYANKEAARLCRALEVPLGDSMAADHPAVLAAVAAAEITVIHWWNHPLLYELMVRCALPPARVALWSHISGKSSPNLFSLPLLSYPDRFVCTTPVSLNDPVIGSAPGPVQENACAIWATAGVDHILPSPPEKGTPFTIGYIGTVDLSKMHRSFLTLCRRITIPDVRFIVCGGGEVESFRHAAAKAGLADRMEIPGQVADVQPWLSRLHLFGYPLSPDHYGTCDQTLTESMVAGVAPVVFNNSMERYMVEHGSTGLVVGSEDEYVAAVEYLYRHPKIRREISTNCRQTALKRFGIKAMIMEWEALFSTLLDLPRRPRRWISTYSGPATTPAQLFLEALGSARPPFEHHMRSPGNGFFLEQIVETHAGKPGWQSPTKGTVHHYRSFFPNDPFLRCWSDALLERRKKY